jgi:hypothetical protein
LIKPGERISTISVPTVLVSYNWPAGTDRYRRVARFTDYLFTRLDKLQVALDGRYDLAGLKIVRDRLAGPCKWPAVADVPRN